MPLETATKTLLNRIAEMNLELTSTDICDVRSWCEEIQHNWDVPQVDVWREDDRVIDAPQGKIPVRVYWPKEAQSCTDLGLLLYFHGGGWIVGSPNISNNMCRHLCRFGQSIVVSVDYRLAPEHKFPAAVDDCQSALRWVISSAAELGANPAKICVGGDSAGGNLAAAICNLAKEELTVWKQLLFYPCLAMYDNHGYRSRELYGNGDYGLSDNDLRFMREQYVDRPSLYRDVRFSPILADLSAQIPSTLIIMPEYDPLRDEGMDYASKLQAAGVPVEFRLYEGVIHGFLTHAGAVGVGIQALNDIAAFLQRDC